MRARTRTAAALILIAAGCGTAYSQAIKGRGIRIEGQPQPVATAGDDLAPPHGYALVIGIARYPTLQDNDLQFSERDAELMQEVLTAKDGGNLPFENVHALIGSKATLRNIQQALEEWLPSVSKEGDSVWIYFAGHGDVRNGKGYLLPYDVDAGDLEHTAYSMERLGKVFSTRIKSSWKVLLTDACHSGAITPDVTEQVNGKLANVDPQVFSFTASQKRESSYESPEIGGGHGIFTYFVAQGLHGQADADGDGYVTADELVDYVRREVQSYTRERDRRQTPSENQDFDRRMVLGYNPAKAGARNTAPLEQVNVTIESNQDGVEVLIDGRPAGTAGKGKPLILPGIAPGVHTVQGNKSGYDPDGPREIMVSPGRNTTISIRIQFARPVKKTAKAEFEEGLKLYNKGSEKDCQEALQYFRKALEEDKSYAAAAMYLGRTYQILYDTGSAIEYLKEAIRLDDGMLDAHLSYGSALLDKGDTNEAARQFRFVTARDPSSSLAWSHLAQAYRLADAYDQAVEAARSAIRMDAGNAQAYLWLGDGLRYAKDFGGAKQAYLEYLRLTDFQAKTYEKIGSLLTSKLVAYDFVGVRRATEKQIYYDLRNLAYLGLCVCEQKTKNLNLAAEYCKKALKYDPRDPFSYFHLGWIDLDRYNDTLDRRTLLPARAYFTKMLAINPDLVESDRARLYIGQIDSLLR